MSDTNTIPFPSANPPNDLEIIAGGRHATAQFRDGTSELVTVRMLTVRQLPLLVGLLEDDAARLEFYVQKEEGYADRLTLQSVEQILATGEELNSGPFYSWVKRKMNVFEGVGGGKILEQLSALAKLPQPSAPASASPANS